MVVKNEGYFKRYNLKPRVVMEAAELWQVLPIAPFCNALADYWHFVDSTFVPPIIFLTGLNRTTVDAWYRKWCAQFPRAVENDFSEFESRVSCDALDLEFDTYDSLGAGSLRPFFELQKEMVLRGSGWTFRRKGGRMSGVPNTSIGNSIINFTTHFEFFQRHGLVPGVDYAMAVNGDDNVLFMTEAAFRVCELHLVHYFTQLAMKAELVFHEDPAEANFCSSKFGTLPDGTYILACHPFRAMAKAGKVPEEGFAGPESIVQLLRDYSSTPNFWPIHMFARTWLRLMGYTYEEAPSAHYSCPISPEAFQRFLETNPPRSDGTWDLPHDHAVEACFAAEGLIEAPGKPENFCMPPRLVGLPPRWGRPGWVKKARAVYEKLLAFWRKTDYTQWSPRLDFLL